MFYALVAVCEALFWVLLGGLSVRYLGGGRKTGTGPAQSPRGRAST